MNAHIDPVSAARREASRDLKSGEFGTQEHAESGIVPDLDVETAGDRIRDIFPLSCWEDETARTVAGSMDLAVLHAWDRRLMAGVEEDQLVLALDMFAADAAAEKELLDPLDLVATYDRVGARFDKVTEEALSRQASLDALAGRPRRVGRDTTVGAKYDHDRTDGNVLAKDIRADLKAAHAAGLFPAGTTVSVTCDKSMSTQSIRAVLRGIPDAQVWEESPDGPFVGARWRTRYARAIDRTLQRIVDAYNKQTIDATHDVFDLTYYGNADIESDAQVAWRLEEAERVKAVRTKKG